ncbi:MAG: sensor histidine kinase [Aquabacterium sp.]
MDKLPNGACPAPMHPQESLRMQALRELDILDTAAEAMFDDVVQLASQICSTPIALISLVDDGRQWFKARVGLDASETPREMAFCAHAILEPNDVLVVGNALQDQRFATNPLVTGAPDIRFYAGAPIVLPNGMPIGTVCAIDREPKSLTPGQADALKALARQVSRMLVYRRASQDRIAQVEQQLLDQSEEAQRWMAMGALDLDVKCFVDRHYRYLAVNTAYLQASGKDQAEVVGKSVAEVRGAAVFDTLLKPHIDRALAGEASTYEADVTYADRGARRVQVRFVPVHNQAGDVLGVVISEHDIEELAATARKLAHTVDALEQKSLAQQKFIYMLSHDLREPVNTIINFAGVIEQKLQGSELSDVQRFAGFVRGGGKRLKALLDRLLDYVRLEQQSVMAQPVDLSAVMADVVQDLDSALQQRHAQLDVQPLPTVQGDPVLLRIILQNFLANAIKFVAPGVTPQVQVRAQARDRRVRIEFVDNGIGIAPEHQGQLFQVFKRLNSLKDFDGVGMGLATCRRIAEMHAGSVGVQSTAGAGSIFWLELPQSGAETPNKEAA